MNLYALMKSAYGVVVPARVRTFLWTNPLTRRPREWLLRRAERLASHEEIYTESYFRNVIDPAAAQSAPIMAASLHRVLSPSTAVDVGCGTGQLLMALAALGVAGRGLEYSDAALAICRDRGLLVERFDLEEEQTLGWKSDLVVSTEVAEHLPASCADRYVALLCQTAHTAVITAAAPGSTGTDHVNEQPNSYWIAKFAAAGFSYDEVQSTRWRQEWREAGVQEWYWKTVMLFRRAGTP